MSSILIDIDSGIKKQKTYENPMRCRKSYLVRHYDNLFKSASLGGSRILGLPHYLSYSFIRMTIMRKSEEVLHIKI